MLAHLVAMQVAAKCHFFDTFTAKFLQSYFFQKAQKVISKFLVRLTWWFWRQITLALW